MLDHLSNLKRATYTSVRVSGHEDVITNLCKVLVMSSVFPQFAVIIRDFKIQRHGRQLERQKNKKTIGLIGKTTTSRVHHTFLYISLQLLHDLTTRKCSVWRFIEDVNKQRRNFFSLSELGHGHLKFSFRRVSPSTFDKVSG